MAKLWTYTYTTAPTDYDGFGTKGEVVASPRKGGPPVRRVATPEEHVAWQRQRYYSGAIYIVADQAEYDKLVAAGLVVPVAAQG